MILTNDKILYSEEGKSLVEKTDEFKYYFKKAFMPPTATIEECLSRFDEILDSEIIEKENELGE